MEVGTRISKYVDRAKVKIQFLKNNLSYVLAFVLITSGALDLYSIAVANYADEWGFVDDAYSAVIKIVMAEFMIFDPKKNVFRAVGFYAMSLGLSRLISSLSILTKANIVGLVVGGFTMYLAINMMVSSYRYMNDTTRGRIGMTFSTIGMGFLALLYLTQDFLFFKIDEDYVSDPVASAAYIFIFLQYFILLIIMDTEELRFNTIREKSNTMIESVRKTYTVNHNPLLSREQALIISKMFVDRSDWTPIADGGPAECEKRLHIIDERIGSFMILQKWKDSEKIHVTMVNDDNESILIANRFSVSDIQADDDVIRLYNDGRLLMNIAVSKEEVSK